MEGVRACDKNAEQYVLEAMLASPDAVAIARGILGEQPNVFYVKAYERVYNAILALTDREVPVNRATVKSALDALYGADGAHIDMAQLAIFEEVGEALWDSANLRYNADVVKNMAEVRRVDKELRDLITWNLSLDTNLADLRERLLDIADTCEGKQLNLIWEISMSFHAYKEHIATLDRKCLKFRWPGIDEATGGLLPGEVCFVLARASVGKSALAQTLQLQAWTTQQIKSVFFSLEMSIPTLYERLISMHLGWSYSKVQQIHGCAEKEPSGLNLLKGLYYVDRAGLSLEDMAAIVRSMGKDIGLVVIDYMGLVRAPGDNDYQRTSHVARGLKDFAKQLNVAVVCLVQTSRAAGDGTQPVRMHMGRDSGVIEEAADVMLSMYRDEKQPKYIHLSVLKARRGRAGATIDMMFWGDTPKIVEVAKVDDITQQKRSDVDGN